MKIAVIGYSGAGKSTLARALGERYDIPVLHFDTVHWAPGWQERDREEVRKIVHEFMEQPQWVIDGNYTNLEYDRRMAEADEIIFLDLPCLTCFIRAWKRFFSIGVRRERIWVKDVRKRWTWNLFGGCCGKNANARRKNGLRRG